MMKKVKDYMKSPVYGIEKTSLFKGPEI